MPQLNLTNPHTNGHAPSPQPQVTPPHPPQEMGCDCQVHDSNLIPSAMGRAPDLDLDQVNQELADISGAALVEWAAQTFSEGLVMSTSFGIQSAVMLHLVTQVVPNIPVIWIDTGYLPAATYTFADELTQRLNLNLKVYQSTLSPARMEALQGRLWESETVEGLNRYDYIRKVEPMQRALDELKATAWLAGLRADQTKHRESLRQIDRQSERYKIYPILTWNSRQIYRYLKAHDLPYHPYFDLGYMTVGDWHSSRPLTPGDKHERETRFRGMKQECGLHVPKTEQEAQSLDSSSL